MAGAATSEPGIDFYGDWQKFQLWVAWLRNGGHIPLVKQWMDELGKQIEQKIGEHILFQDIDWEPLAASTIAKKGHDRIYMDTGKYISSLTHNVTVSGKFDVTLTVFLKNDYPDRGEAVATIAKYLEFGTKRMPARPLWRPVTNELPDLDAMKNFPLEGILGIWGR